MEYYQKAGAGRVMRLTFWVGFSLILLAAGLNLAVVGVAEFAPRLLPKEAYVAYEELKSVVTLTLVGMGLALVIRAALANRGEVRQDARSVAFHPLTLRPRDGGVKLVTARYLPMIQPGWSGAGDPVESDHPVVVAYDE